MLTKVKNYYRINFFWKKFIKKKISTKILKNVEIEKKYVEINTKKKLSNQN